MTLETNIPEAHICDVTDFDFIIGSWQVKHRRLRERLVGSDDWAEFAGRSTTHKIMGGFGNLEDNVLALPGETYRAVALRSFDAVKRHWAIWWLDGRDPHALDTPVVGAFHNGVGLFYANDTLNGQPIRVRFTWSVPKPDQPRWEQAFSADDGKTWETNWEMTFTRET
jgi:hypothetical protein